MNILLVYPIYPDTFWSFKHALKFVSKKAAFPPLGLLTVAAMLPFDWDKKLIDMNTHELTDLDLIWADMVLVSGMIVQKESARDVIKRCKKLNKTIVAGGPLFTTTTDLFPEVDHFVLNEAEITLPLFLSDLKDGNAKRIYSSTERPDITTTPVPLWSLIRFKDYATMAVQFSRGCPFNCEFCDIVVMNGRTPRTKHTDQMMAELQSLYNAGWKGNVFIVDDNFIGNKVYVKELLHKIIAWQKEHKYPLTFLTEASVNLSDDEELMQLMSAANFCSVFLGLETPNPASLKECSKHQNDVDLSLSVKKIQGHGMQVLGGFIVGFDNDTEHIFEAQIKFIQKIGVVTAMVGLLNAIPQTRLWHRLKAEGRLLKDSTGENTDGSLNFTPKMDNIKLIEGYKKILSEIYSPKNYYRRINIFLKNYQPSVKSKVKKSDVMAFAKSTWRIGVFSRARFYYWQLLVKTIITKRKAFPIAVELAIYGEHFKRASKRALLT